MAQHDRYDTDILKQLTRIANSLEKIEKKIPDASRIRFVNDMNVKRYVKCPQCNNNVILEQVKNDCELEALNG